MRRKNIASINNLPKLDLGAALVELGFVLLFMATFLGAVFSYVRTYQEDERERKAARTITQLVDEQLDRTYTVNPFGSPSAGSSPELRQGLVTAALGGQGVGAGGLRIPSIIFVIQRAPGGCNQDLSSFSYRLQDPWLAIDQDGNDVGENGTLRSFALGGSVRWNGKTLDGAALKQCIFRSSFLDYEDELVKDEGTGHVSFNVTPVCAREAWVWVPLSSARRCSVSPVRESNANAKQVPPGEAVSDVTPAAQPCSTPG